MLFNELMDKLNERVSNKITANELVEWFRGNLPVKRYVPITSKYAISGIVTRKMRSSLDYGSDDFDISYMNLRYDVISTFHILLSYVDVKFSDDVVNAKNYDTIVTSGLYDYIMLYAEKDYRDFKEICSKVSGIRDLEILNNFFKIISERFSVDGIENVRKEINKIDMRKLKLLESVAKMNDPLTAQVVQAMKDTSSAQLADTLKSKTDGDQSVIVDKT